MKNCYVPIIDMVTVNWFEIEKIGHPPRNENDRYSVPVLIANAYTGQVEPHTAIYDFKNCAWCLYGLNNGQSSKNYEILEPTHYCLIPPFAI